LFVALIAGVTVRPRFGLHPRLHVLGLLEARLQRFDRMILGGLNEGTWPADPAADPWMSRPMRIAFGLPAPERTVGLAAHDFVQAASAPEVFLTRAEKVGGAPSVPCRWLTRLDTALTAAGLDPARLRDARARIWVGALDAPDAVRPAAPPEPRPPVATRPRRLSVTEIGTWMRDPYAIYARHVLRLRALDPLEAEPGPAERGTFMHTALDAFVRDHRAALPPDALERLLDAGRAAFGDALARPEVHAFWWPRYLRAARFLAGVETEWAANRAGHIAEIEATHHFADVDFTLVGKPDRIDRLKSGGVRVVDYKTGSVPTKKQIASFMAPQLPLLAAMARAGAFGDVVKAPPAALVYAQLTGGKVEGKITELPDAEATTDELERRLKELIVRFDDASWPYAPRVAMEKTRYGSDYDHLSRFDEWGEAAEEIEP
jgi:ATP-dependent helicase/nuclease subunit B